MLAAVDPEPRSLRDIAERCGLPPDRVRASLRQLETDGRVTRLGRTRATRYRLSGTDEVDVDELS